MSSTVEQWFDRKSRYPFRDLSQIQESFDQLFNDFMNLNKTNGLMEFVYSPFSEIAEEDDRNVMTCQLPGVKRDQVKVETDIDQITVRPERKEEKRTDSLI